jgi:hypothetical protein
MDGFSALGPKGPRSLDQSHKEVCGLVEAEANEPFPACGNRRLAFRKA